MQVKNYSILLILIVSLALFSFFFSISNISAIGLGPGRYSTDFSSGASQKFDFIAVNSLDKSVVFKVYVKGELKDYVTCDTESIPLNAKERKSFSCTIKMPSYLEPGPHQALIGVIESAPEGSAGQISVLSAIESRLIVNAPYPGFYVAIQISANNTKINEPASITVKVKNWGQNDATIKVPVDIMSGDKVVGTVTTDEKFIETMQEETFNVNWVANVADSGKYIAVANLVQDNQKFNASTSFLVGDLVMNIVNFTSEMYKGEIGKFDMKLQNMWSEPVSFDLEISILKDDKSIGSKKDKFDINGFEEKDFKIFWDTPLQESGNYKANVTLKYNGKESSSLFDFKVRSREASDKKNIIVISVIILIAVIIVGVILFNLNKFLKNMGRRKK